MKYLQVILKLFLKKFMQTKTKNLKEKGFEVSRNAVRTVVSRKLSKNFYESEFQCKCGECKTVCVINTELVERLQRVRDKYKKSIRITSGCRCKEHNKKVGGSPNSRHLHGDAADITGSDLDLLYELVQEEFEAVGDGREAGNFIHVDLRRDRKRRWTY